MNNSLYHYGVLGMKWGVRRAIKRDEAVRSAKKQFDSDFNEVAKAARKTKTFAITKKGKEKKKALYDDYSKKYDKMAESKKQYDDAQYASRQKAAKAIKGNFTAIAKRSIANMSTGKAIAQSMVLGTFGAAVYTDARSRGAGRGESIVKAILSEGLDTLTFGSLSRYRKRS